MKKYISIFLMMLSFDLYGQVLKEKTNTVTVDFSAEQPAEKSARKYRALIMGVSRYQYEGPNFQSLDRPALDAQEVYNALTQVYTFDPADVILLKDPTRQDIIDALDNLSHVTTENDNLLVFYAGHGYWDEQLEQGYW
ncbi:MAG TPA: caspase family protein, partial [Cyclobacteriaceae bacterium]|nr:caspase family protein [Cyclobacteriaceae bacterium]